MKEPKKIGQAGSDEGYISLSEITVSDDFRCRVQENEETVEAYAETFTKYLKANKRTEKLSYEKAKCLEGASIDYPFPPAWVWQEDGKIYLIAGFHRYKAAEKAGQKSLLVKEFKGTKDKAIECAIKDNLKNGLRLSKNDLKVCIRKVLLLFPDRTSGAIAEMLGRSRSYVYEIEKELSASGQLPSVEKKVGADNKERSTKRKTKQPTVTSVEKSANDPVSEQENPTPLNIPAGVSLNLAKGIVVDNENDNTPFGFETTPPVAIAESIKPSSPELEREMHKTIYDFRKQLSHHRQEDRPYVLHRLKEFLEILEEEWGKITP